MKTIFPLILLMSCGYSAQAQLPSPTPTPRRTAVFTEKVIEASDISKIRGLELVEASECPMPAVQKVKPGFSIQETIKTLQQPVKFQKDASRLGLIGIETAVFKTPNTKSVTIKAYKGVVYEVFVIYDDSLKWDNLIDFILNVGKNLEIHNNWTQVFNEKAFLSCQNYRMYAEKTLTDYRLRLFDAEITRTIEASLDEQNNSQGIGSPKDKSTFIP